MTYRTAGRTFKARKTTARKTMKTRRATKTTRSARTPKNGQAFSVPVGRKGTMPSAWYFGR